MPSPSTRRRTRCCDAQGAGAIVLRINAICAARRGGRVNREDVPAADYVLRINAILLVPVVVPVVVMLRAPVPVVYRINAISTARRGGCVNREEVPSFVAKCRLGTPSSHPLL